MGINLESLIQQALKHHQKSEFDRACAIYKQVLSISPNSFPALQLLGTLLFQTKDLDSAKLFLQKALQINPTDIGVLSNLGAVYRGLKEYEASEKSYLKALAINPNFFDAHYNYGNLLIEIKGYQKALECFNAALSIRVDCAKTFNNKGNALRMLKDYPAAIDNCMKAVSIEPGYAEAWFNLGLIYKEIGQYQKAIEIFSKAIELQPENSDFYNDLGTAYQRNQDLERAILCYRKTLEIDCTHSGAHNNIGAVLQEFKKIKEALNHYVVAIQSNPHSVDPKWNSSVCNLMLGDYESGWQGYESRWQLEGLPSHFLRSFNVPLWLGDHSLEGKIILLHAEQGLGDTLQFCRYVQLVVGLGAKVLLEVQPALVGILKNLGGVSRIFSAGEMLPAFDYHCPLMSLPLAFRTTLETIPNNIPYIKAPLEKVAYWSNRLGPKNRLRVGLVWSGGFRPDQPEVWATNARRNMALDDIVKLKLPEVDFYSLQKGNPAEEELSNRQHQVWPESNFFNFADELKDFSDTAGLIQNLDLVISVDTSTAHLVGAMGKPVWILNRFDSCWRWLLERSDSPWYPTAKLYRQADMGNRGPVVEQVKDDLKRMV